MSIGVGDKVVHKIQIKKASDGVAVDLSDASTITIKYKRPDSIIMTKTGTFLTDGTDGWLRYSFTDGDLTVPGTWECKVKVVKPGWTFTTAPLTFQVHRD